MRGGKSNARRAKAKRRAKSSTPMQRYRDRMRRAGLRLVQFWAPDTKAPGFAEECRRQSRLIVADRKHEAAILQEIEHLSADFDLGDAPDFVPPGDK